MDGPSCFSEVFISAQTDAERRFRIRYDRAAAHVSVAVCSNELDFRTEGSLNSLNPAPQQPSSNGPPIVRFGVFELDMQSGELRKHGVRIRLADQPFKILQLLLAHPGQIVTREQVRQQLWSDDTFVNFDLGLNSAVCKVREALGDTAENPRFVETVPRRGYRFIAHVVRAEAAASAQQREAAPHRAESPKIRSLAILALTVAILAFLSFPIRSWWRDRSDIDGGGHGQSQVVNAEANDALLKGIRAAGRLNYDGFREAIAYYEKAIAAQPDLAQAYEETAFSYLQLLYVGPLAPLEVMPKAELAARKALELNEALPQAHAVLGAIQHRYYWDWESGEREIRRAIELNPDFAPAHEMLIGVLVRAGRFDEALAEAQHALDLDPLSLQALLNRARVFRASGNALRAVAEYRHALGSAAERSRARFQLGVTQVLAGNFTEGIGDLEYAVAMSQRNPRIVAYLGYAYAAAGQHPQARKILLELNARAEREYVSAFGRSLIHDALGERELALSALEKAYREHAVEFSQLDTYPPFRTLAAEPRLHDLMRRVGAPPANPTTHDMPVRPSDQR